jgi:proton-translocating NADH-quinone oxidoreductase chain L
LGHHYEILLILGILSPLISFWLLVLLGPRMGKPGAGWFAVVFGMGIPLVLATIVLIGWLGESPETKAQLAEQANRWDWAMLGDVKADIGVKLDSLTVATYFMVAFVAFWIFVFSIGYMSGHSDEIDKKSKYSRFFAYLCLFGFSMLGLVASSSLLFLYIFWELVGLCSYLLIGYYFDRAYASAAAIKAFITNRIGDFGFLIGLMLVFFQLKTLDLDEAARVFAEHSADGTGIFASSFTLFGWSLATIMGIGLFCGAMGKSAQFPLHVWLPDAMAGPTPVSALIHAATMVAAGVYLVARVFRLMTPEALLFVAAIGCLTLTLMALIAIVQVDIKKCLAYSTLSQLGYMIFGMGCGAWIAALFHLVTHAFFKAMLFLCSGQVIEGCHHEQDMRKMGGLMRKMPVTGITFLVGVLAISGAGIAGSKIGLGGFFSKDEILAVARARAYEWDDPEQYEMGHHEEGHASVPLGSAKGVRLASFTDVRFPAQAGEEKKPQGTVVRQGKTPPRGDLLELTEKPGHRHPPERIGVPGEEEVLAADHAKEGDDSHAATHAAEHEGHAGHARFSEIFAGMPKLPKWMFWLAIITAYVTPFYMTRCWWMTFMGKPRDEHVHEHAHEIPLMYVPLIVLAVGTAVSGYFWFRPLIAEAAPAATAAPLVVAIDGKANTAAIHAAHGWLKFGVGFAFIVGIGLAVLIYRKGLATAERIKQAAGPLYVLLERKYFFDELYNWLLVKGCILVSKIVRFFDTWFVDLIFDLTAAITERFSAFIGRVIDVHGVDGFFNGVSKTSMDIAGIARAPQTGRIRNYVLFAVTAATIVVIVVLYVGIETGEAASTVVTPAAP